MEPDRPTVNALPREFIALASDVLGVGAEMLSPSTEYGSIPEWDSVAHLRLVMETEARFGRAIPLEVVPTLKSLEDFRPYVEDP